MRDLFAYQRLSITSVCQRYELSRQAYYKMKTQRQKCQKEKEQVLKLVRIAREQLPREGVKKLYRRIKPDLQAMGLKLGRDKLMDILRSEQLLIKPRKKYVKTTHSSHRFRIYDNLTTDLDLTGTNQLWVSDITYIRTHKGFMFLALVTDAYSRKIVGYDISDSLELEGCLRALKMGLKTLPQVHELIHHSDRGVQYCSYDYTDALKAEKVQISMASKGNCYENAMAERVNGILKQEFFLDVTFNTKQQAVKACKDAISLYNKVRLHMNIDYLTPNQKHAV